MSLSRPVSRERMLPWLKKRIDSGLVPGLYWLNESDFRVPWKHAGKPDFNLDKDAALFRMWAEHTGKYRPGEQPDPSTWKTRFRCALRKQPDISEVHMASSLDDNEPFRVFRIHNRGSRSSSSSSPQVLPSDTPSLTSDIMEVPSYSNTDQPSHIHRSLFDNINYDTFPSPDSSYASSCSDDDDLDNITPTLHINMVDESIYSQNMPADSQRSDNFGFNSHVTQDVYDDVFSVTSQQNEILINQLTLQDQNDLASQLGYLNAFFGSAVVDELAQQYPNDYFTVISDVYQELQNSLMQQQYMGI